MPAVEFSNGAEYNGTGSSRALLRFDRRDVLKLIGLVLAVVTAAAGLIIPLMAYVFQTRHQALVEHAAIEQAAALVQQASLLRQKATDSRNTRVDSALADAKKILRTLDINQRTIMRDASIPRWKVEALPAGIDFDDVEMEE